MKKIAMFLTLIIVLGTVASCKPANTESDISGTESQTTSNPAVEDKNLINTVAGIDGALKNDIDRSKSYKKVNIIKGQSYTLLTKPSDTYADDGKKLTDDVIGKAGEDFSAKDWIGFVSKKRIEFIVDLGEKVSDITEIGVNVNYDSKQSRKAPKTIDYYISDDGETFTRVGSSTSTNDNADVSVYTHLLKLQKTVETRYIRVIMTDITSNWVHIDSFQVYKYEEATPVTTSPDYYKNNPLPEVTKPELWSSSDSDYNQKKNLLAGLSQRIYLLSPLLEDLKTDYFNTPASTTKLTDGQKGGKSYTDPNFAHFTRGLGRDIVFDLTKLSALSSASIGFLSDTEVGVNLPTAVAVYVSEDAKNWQKAAHIMPTNKDSINLNTIRFDIPFNATYKARFVKISLMIPGHCWVDEIEVFGTKNIDGAKTIVPDSDTDILTGEYPKPEKLGGAENILLAYNFKTENPDAGLTTKDEYLPYVGYYDTEGNLKDFFFDSYLYLPCMTVCPSGGVLYHNPSKPAFASDWLAYEEDTFAKDHNINALNEAVGEIKSQLKNDDYVATVFLSIFSTVSTQKNFGDIDGDGITEDFSKIGDRKKAIKWWIDRQISRYKAGNYENLKLNGFYWYHEALEFSDPNELELAQFTSDYVHSLGYYIIWIPYYQAAGFSEWSLAGFDVANMQPNYMFNENSTASVVYDNAQLTKDLGMGVEIEIDGKVFSSNEYYERYLTYLRAGVETGYMNAIKMYYQDAGPGVYYNAYKSTNPRHRALYDLTYLYAKKKLTLDKLVAEQTEFKTAQNTPLTNSIRIKDKQASTTVAVSVNAKYGKVYVSPNGSFTYTPMNDFKGTDTFIVVASDGLASSEFVINVVVE